MMRNVELFWSFEFITLLYNSCICILFSLKQYNKKNYETDNEEISLFTAGRNKKRRRLEFMFEYQATLHHRSDSDYAEDQLARYIELINREDLEIDDQFDACFRSEFDKLWPLFSRLWCVPATSAPVERIFSQSGIIMRPHRAKMPDKLLETIMFLKCNT